MCLFDSTEERGGGSSEQVALRHPVMPVANHLGSGFVGINGGQGVRHEFQSGVSRYIRAWALATFRVVASRCCSKSRKINCRPQKICSQLAGVRPEDQQGVVESEVVHFNPLVLVVSSGPQRREPLSPKTAGPVPGT